MNFVFYLLSGHPEDRTIVEDTVSSIYEDRLTNDNKSEASSPYRRQHIITNNSLQNGFMVTEPNPTKLSERRSQQDVLAREIYAIGSPASTGRVVPLKTSNSLKTGVAVLLLAFLVVVVALMHFKVCAELQRLWRTIRFTNSTLGRYWQKLNVWFVAAVCGRRKPSMERDEAYFSTDKPLISRKGTTPVPIAFTMILTETVTTDV